MNTVRILYKHFYKINLGKSTLKILLEPDMPIYVTRMILQIFQNRMDKRACSLESC